MAKGKAIVKAVARSGKFALKKGTRFDSVTRFLKKHPAKLLPKITLRRVALGTGAGVAIAYGVDAMQTYMSDRSGCFLYEGDRVLCKIPELSCCNPYVTENTDECSGFLAVDECAGYDEDSEKSCCRRCDCAFHDCLPNQRMECKKISPRRAFEELTLNVGKSLIDTIASTNFVKYLAIALAVIVASILIFKLKNV